MPAAVCEKPIERTLREGSRAAGFLALKLVSPARTGVPDRVLVTGSGTVFIEVKRPGGTLEPHQLAAHAKIRRFGGEVHTVDTVASVRELLRQLSQRPHHGREAVLPPPRTQRLRIKESPVESRLLNCCRQHRMLCLKFISPARAGVPDRIVVSPTGTVFVELKRPGGVPEPRQQAVHTKLRRFGGEVFTLDTPSDADWLTGHLFTRTPQGRTPISPAATIPSL